MVSTLPIRNGNDYMDKSDIHVYPTYIVSTLPIRNENLANITAVTA
nr:hypothetical protein [uncultured Lachnoanaerobaculum sp.]